MNEVEKRGKEKYSRKEMSREEEWHHRIDADEEDHAKE